MENCAKGGCPEKDADTCPSCVFWSPSRGSKYSRCAQYLARKIVCLLPEDSCGSCSFYLPVGVVPRGPENVTGTDWSDPAQVNERRRFKKLQMATLPPCCGVPGCAEAPRHFHVEIYGGKAKAHLCRSHYAVLRVRNAGR